MAKRRTLVKPIVTGDVEHELLQKRLARREASYQKVCAQIERTQRKLEKADKTVGRCIRLIAKLERQRRRLDKQKAELSRLAADDMVKAQAAPESELVRAKKKRKAKAESHQEFANKLVAKTEVAVAEAASELAQSDLPRLSAMFPFGKQAKLSDEDREKAVQLAEQKRDEKRERMRQLGFHPTNRRLAKQVKSS